MKNKRFNEPAPEPVSLSANEGADEPDEPVTETVFICDECGDTLWDAVLEQ